MKLNSSDVIVRKLEYVLKRIIKVVAWFVGLITGIVLTISLVRLGARTIYAAFAGLPWEPEYGYDMETGELIDVSGSTFTERFEEYTYDEGNLFYAHILAIAAIVAVLLIIIGARWFLRWLLFTPPTVPVDNTCRDAECGCANHTAGVGKVFSVERNRWVDAVICTNRQCSCLDHLNKSGKQKPRTFADSDPAPIELDS